MGPVTARAGLAAAVFGSLLLLEVAAVNRLLEASETGLWFRGRPIGAACMVRERFGLPCPSCGFTRSSVLAAHGEWVRAARTNAAGPLAVMLAVLFGIALLGYALLALRSRTDAAAVFARWLRRAGIWAALLMGVVWLGGWLVALGGALHSPR